MTVFWLIIWLLSGTPNVQFSPANAWAIGLIVCLIIDVMK